MNRRVLLILFSVSLFATTQAKSLTPVSDHDTLCSLNFGKYENGNYVGSTPMEDACRTEHVESRYQICMHNYSKPEIVNACVATFDAIAHRVQLTLKNGDKKHCPENDPLGNRDGNEDCLPVKKEGVDTNDPLGIKDD